MNTPQTIRTALVALRDAIGQHMNELDSMTPEEQRRTCLTNMEQMSAVIRMMDDVTA